MEIGINIHGSKAILAIAISKDGKILVSGGEDKAIRIWNHNFVKWNSDKEDFLPKLLIM